MWRGFEPHRRRETHTEGTEHQKNAAIWLFKFKCKQQLERERGANGGVIPRHTRWKPRSRPASAEDQVNSAKHHRPKRFYRKLSATSWSSSQHMLVCYWLINSDHKKTETTQSDGDQASFFHLTKQIYLITNSDSWKVFGIWFITQPNRRWVVTTSS